jgi:hypothetical protein
MLIFECSKEKGCWISVSCTFVILFHAREPQLGCLVISSQYDFRNSFFRGRCTSLPGYIQRTLSSTNENAPGHLIGQSHVPLQGPGSQSTQKTLCCSPKKIDPHVGDKKTYFNDNLIRAPKSRWISVV